MYKSVDVYEGDKLLGEVDVVDLQNGVVVDEIRISHFSPPSERCPPLAVLHMITTSTSTGVCFKLECKSQFLYSQLNVLHSTCLRENKTAVMPMGGGELHLVAMLSMKSDGQRPCFWGFNLPSGLYNSCLVMLNLRCLGIVFDLDETLVVANTMRSFEDRIEALQRKINSDSDPQRVSGILAEVKRYQDDKIILKQYAENDQVVENGKVIKSQPEVVPALSDNHQPIVRPIIRLQDKNIILTRINPLIRDTSVLVRLRPAWEDMRSYLIARGRKRFEVYVCTMAERDYALEMWRLLDPESKLINTKELLDRMVCVKAGLKKSLFNVFQDGSCHPKMALVIDDRLKVWDEKDQPRVHVVPAFAPYYAPQAEANNAIPVLCVARNVACNVRGGFFKEFDEGLLQRIQEVKYEDDAKDIPVPPDVSNFLISEDDALAMNANRDPLSFDGMADAEVEKRLKDATSASSSVPSVVANVDPRLLPPQQYTIAPSTSIPAPTMQVPVMPFSSKPILQMNSVVKPLTQVGLPEQSLQSSPAREEGEVPESELDPDTRRRLLILQHGQDVRDPPPSEPQFPVRPPLQVAVQRGQGRGSWFSVEEEMSPRELNHGLPGPIPTEFTLQSESMRIEKQRPHHPPFLHKVESSIPSDRVFTESQKIPKEPLQRDRLRSNLSLSNYPSFSGEEVSVGRSSSGNRDLDMEHGRDDTFAETPLGALQDIALKCGTKVEFRTALVPTTELQFSVEVWFVGEKIGEAIGRTRREAQRRAAEGSLMSLADRYISRLNPDFSSMQGDGGNRFFNSKDNGFVSDESLTFPNGPEPSRVMDPRLEGPRKLMGSVSALKELCMMEGLGLAFQPQPQFSGNTSSFKSENGKKNLTVRGTTQACNYAKGKWITDDNWPLYSGFGCKQWLSSMWACRLTQRTDFAYEKLRWQPKDCEMDDFTGFKFLTRMRDKTLAFIGDSLGRQQFQSLMCMVTGGKERPDVLDVGWEYGLVKARGHVRPDGWAYRFPTTNTTILYYWSASLCDLEPFNITNPTTEYAMHLDRPPAFLKNFLPKFNIVVLNTGHHWNRGKFTANRWVMYVGGKPNTNKKIADIGGAKNFTIYSIVNWVNSKIPKYPGLKAFYRSISPRHFFNGDWNTGGTCDNTTPRSGDLEVTQDASDDPQAAGAVNGTRVKFLDITAISQLRDEGHISRYSINATPGVQDCLHWCLPGVPDTWNELLFAQL